MRLLHGRPSPRFSLPQLLLLMLFWSLCLAWFVADLAFPAYYASDPAASGVNAVVHDIPMASFGSFHSWADLTSAAFFLVCVVAGVIDIAERVRGCKRRTRNRSMNLQGYIYVGKKRALNINAVDGGSSAALLSQRSPLLPGSNGGLSGARPMHSLTSSSSMQFGSLNATGGGGGGGRTKVTRVRLLDVVWLRLDHFQKVAFTVGEVNGWSFLLPFLSSGLKDKSAMLHTDDWTNFQTRHAVMAAIHIAQIFFVEHSNSNLVHDSLLAFVLPVGFAAQELMSLWLTGHSVYEHGEPGLTSPTLAVDHIWYFWALFYFLHFVAFLWCRAANTFKTWARQRRQQCLRLRGCAWCVHGYSDDEEDVLNNESRWRTGSASPRDAIAAGVGLLVVLIAVGIGGLVYLLQHK